MNFRDRNYMITSSSTESLKGAAFLSKMLGILGQVADPERRVCSWRMTANVRDPDRS